MLRILRITLMWLLALAVPVQGFAAASMVGCGAGHQAGGMQSHSHGLGLGQHEANAPQSHDHHGHAHGEAHVAVHADMHMAGIDGAAHAGVSKASCSACASCCTAAALPATPMVFEVTDAPSVFVALAPQPVVSFVSGGLERPPRPFLA